MPLLLIRKTWPVALIWPKMLDGSLPTTRLSVEDVALGCRKFTVSPLPTLKVCQLMMPLLVVWVTLSVLLAGVPMVMAPAATWPPVGSVCACACTP
jgi:hypothetical protein